MASRLTDYLLAQPLYGFGQSQIAQGTSTAPVHSWAEGLARSLQGGIAGLSMGQGMAQAKDEQAQTAQRLAQAMGMMDTDPRGAQAMIASDPYLADIGQGFALQRGTLANQEELARYNLKIQQDAMDQDAQRYGVGGGGQTSQGGGATSGGGVNDYNIGNVRPPGASTGFQQPPTMQDGIALAQNTLRAYPGHFNGGQPMSLTQIGAHWAPSNENNTGAWVNNVSRIGGLDPNKPLDLNDPATMAALTRGIHGAEKGQQALLAPEAYIPRGPGGAQPIPNYTPGSAQPTPIPNYTPGTAQPQPVANVPQQNGEFINYQGLQLPRAQVAAAMQIPDLVKRREMMATIVGAAVNRNIPGTTEGDAYMLERGLKDPSFAATPEYKAAYINKSKPQMAQGGQLYFPDMSAYPAPPGVQQNGQGGRFQDTPGGIIDAEQKLRKDFTDDPAVKNYLQVKPVFEAMKAAKEHPTMAADTNMVAALANIYAPGSANLPRGEMYKRLAEIESLPQQFRTAINQLAAGKGMDDASRQALINEAQTRMGPMLNEFNARVQQHTKIAQDYGLDPSHVIVLPSQEKKEAEGGEAKVRKFNPSTGRLE